MKGGLIPEHFMISLEKDEGDRLRELLSELRTVDRAEKQYRMNLNEAEDELLEAFVEKLSPRD